MSPEEPFNGSHEEDRDETRENALNLVFNFITFEEKDKVGINLSMIGAMVAVMEGFLGSLTKPT